MPPVAKTPRTRSDTFLAAWRKKAGLTQADASDLVGVTQSQVSRVERGEGPYDQDFLELAAIAYGCDEIELLRANPKDPNDLWTLLVRAAKAPPADRERIAAFIAFTLRKP